MSDIGVSYDMHYTPAPIGVNLSIQITGTTVRVSITDVPRVLVTATPHYSANIASDILSTIGTPMANAITATAGVFATEILQNKTFDIYTLPPIRLDTAGISVQLLPSNLSLGNYNGMLLLTGDFTIQ